MAWLGTCRFLVTGFGDRRIEQADVKYEVSGNPYRRRGYRGMWSMVIPTFDLPPRGQEGYAQPRTEAIR